MRGHLGAVLTSGLAAVALALATLQLVVLAHSASPQLASASVPQGPTNRYSIPGGRSGIPWLPGDHRINTPPQPQSPGGQKQEERRSPAPPRLRPPQFEPGPRVPRRATA